jgi:glycosyltransferase involved in cell wall biosynthesis
MIPKHRYGCLTIALFAAIGWRIKICNDVPRPMPKPRKVLLLGAEPASLINFRGPLIRHLIALGHEVHVAAKQASAEQVATLAKMGVAFHSVPFARAGMNPFRDVATGFALYKLFKSLRPEVVISYTSKPVIYGTLAAQFADVPHIVAMVTGLGYSFIDGPERKRKFAKWVSSRLYGLALPRCAHVLFQNPDDRADFEKLGLLRRARNVAVVNGSGVDTDYFATAPLPAKPAFLLIARLLADKGVREFTEAVSSIKPQLPDVEFRLLGGLDPSPNGVAAAEVQSWAAKGVVYLGETKDVRPVITAASVIVLPSYREGTPRSVLEGMAMGRAIVTTDVPGCRETVVDGVNGLLVPVRNAAALAAAMLVLAGDPERVAKMGEASRRIAVEKYKAEVVAQDTARKAGLEGDA